MTFPVQYRDEFYTRPHKRKFSAATFTEYKEYLQDRREKEPIRPSRAAVRAAKSNINKNYIWDGVKGNLIYQPHHQEQPNSLSRICAHPDQIFDILLKEYKGLKERNVNDFWDRIKSKYYAITQDDTRHFYSLYAQWRSAATAVDDVQTAQVEAFQSSLREPLAASLVGTRFDVDRQTFRHLDTISEPAENGSSVLLLSMDDVGLELVKPGGPKLPVIIRGGASRENLKTIKKFFEDWPDLDLSVQVQDPNRPGGLVTRTMTEVKNHFDTSGPKESPWNILDLECNYLNVFPQCLDEHAALGFLGEVRKEMLDLSLKRKKTGKRQSARLEMIDQWKLIEKWCLMSPTRSRTLPHQDTMGLWTFVVVHEGVKKWIYNYQMSDSDWQEFGKKHVNFAGGKWADSLLRPGDILFMRPGQIHAVGTVDDALCIGGHFLSATSMVETLSTVLFQLEYPDTTNDAPPCSLVLFVKAIERLVLKGPATKFGGEERATEILRLCKECLECLTPKKGSKTSSPVETKQCTTRAGGDTPRRKEMRRRLAKPTLGNN